jgi:hypothetical protein
MEAVDKVMPGGTIKVAMKWAKGDKVVYKVVKAVEAGRYMTKVAGDGTLLAVLHHDVMKIMWKRRKHKGRKHRQHKDKEHKHKEHKQ